MVRSQDPVDRRVASPLMAARTSSSVMSAPQFPDSPSRRTDATEREQTRSSRGGLAHARHNSAPARRRGSPRLQRGVAQVSRPRLRHRRAWEPLATCPRSSPRVAASESNPSSRTCLTHAWTAMATVAAASDARPRRYAKEQPTAAPFPPPQADFSLAGHAVIQGVADGLAFGALVPMVVSWHTATLRPRCGSTRTAPVPGNCGRHPEPSDHICELEHASLQQHH